MLFFFCWISKIWIYLTKTKFVALYEMLQPCLMAQIKAFDVSFKMSYPSAL